jgi:hypothetical protein
LYDIPLSNEYVIVEVEHFGSPQRKGSERARLAKDVVALLTSIEFDNGVFIDRRDL